ncbi:M20/M25/M40 family metallo-hydrolase [Oceanihabitans sediminis]|uniref:Carboxypeptidase Q n=1 Tax=Oceanihabitans sediminis TaxID=1812012 RepID=A0A368P4Y6_9FLAO|nr:M20/M25/M40 family metallo-hydrolase [Oceanihabitans sediminis]MDX1278140.1 M20/M25/M40 family metallo-hydrolase [Oceanihabitans sediminis]MDX1774073.1 M20/M25/M40 family metallo-hydrolase [Oceanihabitans sediminis]RBP30886.1 PA domain-containing protein [Oceanihabitans sediminis]RCU56849.1 peptidase M28 family protein [Oceanihabitans sediminis]
MNRILYLLIFLLSFNTYAQSDEEVLRTIYTQSLTNGKSYAWLDYLSNQIGGRLSGSLQAERAVQWGKEELEKLGLDKVWLQEVMVPKWVRGAKEYAYIESSKKQTTNVNICALGGSVATNPLGLKAKVVEVHTFEDLEKLGEAQIKGKIVFYNRPMQPELISTFSSYGGCVNQRYSGAVEAAKYGAVGVIVRSMSLRLDDLPHTGSMTYGNLPVEKRIPSAAISTNHAELLSASLKLDKDLEFYFKQSCTQYDDVLSHNVIGEITGSEFPNEYFVVGGHLDSWDLGDGAHDDGAGVVQSMDVLRLLKESGIKPKRSIRVVLFMNEENGLRGGRKYAEVAKQKGENHVFALESDAGGFTPRGFSFDCSDADFEQVLSWKPLFKPYLIHYFEKGGSGADISPLKTDNNVLCGLRPDSQRYFDHHHAASDTFDAVNKRELELGAATMTALVYLFDKYGTNPLPNQSGIKN